ncbi:Uncharacterised protein [uncultured archaeon]|nr:Uncharacterised protein [uncultured archaeon]
MGFQLKLELSGFAGQPCSSRIAYEFIPKARHTLNLEAIAKSLREKGVYIEIETPAILMLKINARAVSLFRSGKIIVKSTNDKAVARETAEMLIEKIE